MQYVIPLNMTDENREVLNNQVTDIADKIIIGAGYVPIIFVIGTIYKVYLQDVDVWFAFCRLVTYSAVIGFMISLVDAIDKWLSLKWSDLEIINKKSELLYKVKESLFPMVLWILNFIIFGFILK